MGGWSTVMQACSRCALSRTPHLHHRSITTTVRYRRCWESLPHRSTTITRTRATLAILFVIIWDRNRDRLGWHSNMVCWMAFWIRVACLKVVVCISWSCLCLIHHSHTVIRRTNSHIRHLIIPTSMYPARAMLQTCHAVSLLGFGGNSSDFSHLRLTWWVVTLWHITASTHWCWFTFRCVP